MHDATGTGAIVPIHRQISNGMKGNIMATTTITDATLDLTVDGIDYLYDLLVIDANVDWGGNTDFEMDFDTFMWYRERINDAKYILDALDDDDRERFIDEVLVHEFTDDTIDAWLDCVK